jgi:hypothetical protein
MTTSTSKLQEVEHVFREIAKNAGLKAISSPESGYSHQYAATRDVVKYRVQLPQVRGVVEVHGEQLSATRPEALVDYLTLECRHVARMMRGQQLLDILNGGDWVMPADNIDADLQLMKRASIMMMEHVDQIRKGRL